MCLVLLDVSRTEREPEVVSGVTKFIYFISVDGAVITRITRRTSSESSVRTKRVLATLRSKNSSRDNAV